MAVLEIIDKITNARESNACLSLNVSKTNFIIFCSSKQKYNPELINISLNDHQKTQIKYTKFLGVCI